MKNRVLALLLCILMCLSMFPASAFAEGGSYYVYFWYTSPLTVNESGYSDCLPVGEAILVDESSDYIIGPVPGSILQGLRSYAQSQNLQDHCIVSWTVKETGEAFDFANRRVDELASEDHTLNLLATWGTENSHNWGDWYTAQEATCSAPGTRTHTCYICRTSASETIPAAHRINPIPVEAEPATCTENGTIAYYVCDDCGTKFYDAEGREAVTDAVAYAPGHALRYCEAEPATCTEDGTIAHYVCDVCGKYFSDAEGANELTTITDPCPGHEMTYYPETAATCTEKGNRAYYYCEKCCGYFGDENGEDPLDATSVVTDVNPNAHEWENGVCIRKGCGAVCNHENAADGVCQTCGETVTHEEKRFTLFAANPLQATSAGTEGSCGEQVQWALTDEGATLTISGTGAMNNYDNSSNRPPWYAYRDTIESVVVGEGITGIGNYAFCEHDALTSISLPAGLTSIGNDAFACTSMTAIVLPETITNIGEWAFNGALIEKINIPNGVTTISNGAFSACSSLTDVTIPGSVKSIGPSAFASCANLAGIVIPEGVETIGSLSFSNCTKLEEITLPESLEAISLNAFENCNGISTVHYNGSETNWNTLKASISNDNQGNNYLLNAEIVFGEESGAGADLPTVKGLNHVVDNGSRVTGTIAFESDGRKIQYVKQNAKPTDGTQWETLNGTRLSDINAGGTYWFHYEGQPIDKVDSVVIDDYYSVTFAKKGSAIGKYEVVSTGTTKHENDVYLVKKGGSISVKFIPDNGWMLHEVAVDGSYVGKENVKETMTFENITKAIKIEYAFSNTTPNSDSFTLTALYDSSLGQVILNDKKEIKSGETQSLAPGKITLEFRQKTGTSIILVKKDGEVQELKNRKMEVTGVNGDNIKIDVVFAVPGVTRESSTASNSAAKDVQNTLSSLTGFSVANIPYKITSVTPWWFDGKGNLIRKMEDSEIRETGGIRFKLDPPEGTKTTSHSYLVFHYNTKLKEYESVEDVDLVVTTTEFSDFAVFAIPQGPNKIDLDAVASIPRVNDGNKQTGGLTSLVDGMVYKKSGEPDSAYRAVTTPTTRLEPGDYFVKIYNSSIPARKITIADMVTVTFEKKGNGKGSYEVTDAVEFTGESNTYLVEKNGSLTVQFKPENGYWLYEVDRDGTYVGQANVKETMKFENIKNPTVIKYGFSDQSKSPKTGDQSEVNLWIAEEIVSLLGMTAITWYLFRRKET